MYVYMNERMNGEQDVVQEKRTRSNLVWDDDYENAKADDSLS